MRNGAVVGARKVHVREASGVEGAGELGEVGLHELHPVDSRLGSERAHPREGDSASIDRYHLTRRPDRSDGEQGDFAHAAADIENSLPDAISGRSNEASRERRQPGALADQALVLRFCTSEQVCNLRGLRVHTLWSLASSAPIAGLAVDHADPRTRQALPAPDATLRGFVWVEPTSRSGAVAYQSLSLYAPAETPSETPESPRPPGVNERAVLTGVDL